ncbi:MAG: hypothetical protein Q7J23_00940 [Nitrosomonas sp.]|nr:hypothetical protein [Nitrosomonas sp.]
MSRIENVVDEYIFRFVIRIRDSVPDPVVDATGGIVGQRAGVAADAVGFEPAIGVETACVHSAISSTSSF